MPDMYDDEAAPSTAQNPSTGGEDEHSDETEDQLALVPSSFFQNKNISIKPGQRETVEIVEVYENEVSIKCVYKDEDEDEEEEEEPMMTDESAPSEAEDAMMM